MEKLGIVPFPGCVTRIIIVSDSKKEGPLVKENLKEDLDAKVQ
jgi:hypothetical protein